MANNSNNSKKYVSLTRLSDFLDNIKEKYSQIGHKHTMSDITDYTGYTIDSELSSTSTNPVQNKVIDAEFDAIATAMGALENAIDGKVDGSHNHDDRYYTEAEINDKLSNINTDISDINTNISDINTSLIDINVTISKKVDIDHNHDDLYDAKGSADTALNSAKSYTDTKVSDLIAGTDVDNKISTHDTSSSAHSDIRELVSDLATRLDGFSGGGSGNGSIPDWNQNDSAAADYIKNRPFYTAQVEKEIYDVNAELAAVSGSLASMQVSATEYLHSINTTDLDYAVNLVDLVVGKQYVVIVDGNRYEYTAKSMVMPEGYNGATALYIGEGEEFISQDIANFTVGIANVVYPNGYSLATIGCKTTSATPPASFKVYAVEEETVQIDPKYYERLAWTEKKGANTWTFDGNIDSVEYYDVGDGAYYIRVLDRYIEPEALIGGSCTGVLEGVEETVTISENMIRDVSPYTGFPAYSVNGQFGLVISDTYNGLPAGVYIMYVPNYVVISELVFAEEEVVHTIDPKFLPTGGFGWIEKGTASNIWEFNGNLDSVEHYQIGEGQYYIRVLDAYQEPEFFVGVTSEINAEGNILTGVFTEDMIEDMSEQTGFPAYGIQNQMGLVLSQEFNGMPEGFYVIYVQDNTVVQKIIFTQDVFVEPDVVHKVNQKYIPNADWSINDPEAEGYIKNRPFYDGRIIGDVSIDWDGSTDGRTVINDRFYKVSDNVITEDQFKEATFTFEGGTYPTSMLYSNNMVSVTENYIDAAFLMIVTTPFDLEDGNGTLAETGIYFSSSNGMNNLTYQDYIGGDFVKIDPIYLPDNIGGGGVTSWNDLEDKPFGDDCAIKEKGEEIFSISYDFVASDRGEILYSEDSVLEITEGETYFVDYDGTTYECIAYLANAGSDDEPNYLPVIGNVEIVGMSGGNAEPFFIGISDIKTFVYVQTEGTHDVVLYACVDGVGLKKLDKKYLPDDIGGVTSWNDLKDKPFGDEMVRNDILTISHEFTNGSDGVDPYTEPSTFAFAEGEAYFVDYDGTTYECVAYYAEGPNTACIGNGTIGDVNGGNSEPFFATVFNGSFMVFSETEGTHDISIYTIDDIKKLDKKYLPEIKWNNIVDKPFDYTIGESLFMQSPVVIETKLNASGAYALYSFSDLDSEYKTLVKDAWYKVVFNETEYFCKCITGNVATSDENTLFLGNVSIQSTIGTINGLEYTGYENKKEPFCLRLNHYDNGMRALMLFTKPELAGWNGISVHKIDVEQIQDMFIVDSAYNDIASRYNNFYYANVSTTDYSNHQLLGIGDGVKIVKISDEVPSRDFFIGKYLYMDLVNTKALKSTEEAEFRLTITEDFIINLVDIVDPEVADEIAAAFGDAFIIGEFFMIIPQDFEVEESGINITAGVWAIDQSDRLNTMEYAMRIGDDGRTINSSLIPRTIARISDVAQKITAPTTAQVGDLLTFDGTNWVSISKADLIAEIIAALPSAEEASF